MDSPADRANSNSAKLQAALLEYFGAPGKFQLSLRQPALLFSSIRDVLQLAAGRSAGVEQENKAVMEAAAFFIRAALLYPGATHYAVMGLPSRTEPVELKERYRLLMRLIHPDFAEAHAQTWPGDAAVRVNRAYEVLSSSVLRAEYDEQLVSAGSQRPPVSPKRDIRVPATAVPAETASWRFNRAAVWVLAVCGGLVVVAWLVPWQGPDQLVQKVETPAIAAAEAGPAPSPLRAEPVVAANPASQPLTLQPPTAPSQAVAVPPPVRLPVAAPARTVAAAPAVPRAEPPMQLRASASAPPVRAQALPAARTIPPQPQPQPATVQASIQAPRLAAAMQLSAPDAVRTAERRVEAPVAVVVAPAPATLDVAAIRQELPRPPPVAASGRPEPGPTGTEPSLNDAQPLLTQLLQSLEGGSGESILRLLEGDARHAPAALALSRQYEQLVGRARPVRLSHVEFRGEARQGVLLVTGRVRLHAGEPTIGAVGERMSLRAEFVSRGGKVLLTGLSSGSD